MVFLELVFNAQVVASLFVGCLECLFLNLLFFYDVCG